jgi:hypothetical protein
MSRVSTPFTASAVAVAESEKNEDADEAVSATQFPSWNRVCWNKQVGQGQPGYSGNRVVLLCP